MSQSSLNSAFTGSRNIAPCNSWRPSLVPSEVRRGVFVFTGAGGNITAIQGSLGCTVVDSGFGPRLAEIEAGLAAAVPQAPRWLINTHWHFDHTDANAAFAAAGATILAHANCRFRLES